VHLVGGNWVWHSSLLPELYHQLLQPYIGGGLSSSKTVLGGVFASRHGRFRGGALATNDFGANEVLTRVKLLPRKLVTICFTLPVRTATAAQ